MTAAPLEDLCLHRVLVAIDGSEQAELAVRAAVTAAHRDHAAVTLITVAPDVAHDMSRLAAVAGVAPPSQEEIDQAAGKVLREAVERMPGDLTVTTVLRRGKAGPEILAEADAHPYDGIILGARGVGRVGALMGSVSAHVLRHAKVPVVVVHGPRS